MTRFFRTPVICRVCGISFLSERLGAITCSSTCRQRLRRGQAFAYLTPLKPSERRRELKWHAAYTRDLAQEKRANAAERERRAKGRPQREERRAMKRKRLIAEMLGMRILEKAEAEEKQRRQNLVGTVAGMVKLFASQPREIAAQAIADFLNMPHHYPTAAVAEALDQLRADGEYDRIVVEGLAMRKGGHDVGT